MQLAEPAVASWKAKLELGFSFRDGKTTLADRRQDGPLVVQKPLYPEGPRVCHAIVVHPPGGIAGGDELLLSARISHHGTALLTTPGAGKWYRSAGPWASQKLAFAVEGTLEWLPRETIVFDGARATLECAVDLGRDARFIGWEVVCLGRRGSGERFGKGTLRFETRISREGKMMFFERGEIEGGGRLMASPAGLGGRSVFGSMLVAFDFSSIKDFRNEMPDCFSMTLLPGLLIARYLGDAGEEALRGFTHLWSLVRPLVTGREAIAPRIWAT